MRTKGHHRTRHFNIMLIVLAIAGLVAVLVAIDPMARASQKSVHGWTGHRGAGDVAAAVCDGSHDGRMNEVEAYLGSTLDLNAAQKKAWDQVERELVQGLARLRDACGDRAPDALPPTVPERLAFMESAMAAGTETVRTVRPAFEAFYETLDEGQRRKIEDMSRRHGAGAR
jgi:hypothetical protein